MRHFHVLKNRTFAKTVNVDKLWSLAGAEAYEKAKTAKGQAPLLDLTKLVRFGDVDTAYLGAMHLSCIRCCYGDMPSDSHFMDGSVDEQGYFKVLGKGALPKVPLVVRAKYFSKDVSSTCTCRDGDLAVTF